ncbi:hypothetical protein RN001_008131 [Aquatica leii]|uniref:Zinc finger CHCC-type domain-containing protein n=1 Tax=Aquatica leii TaxID=1421715 RepID=A0AAN7P3V1_9COLE|nr:hypothetical protein RN001_008131 [Aquatica leii]
MSRLKLLSLYSKQILPKPLPVFCVNSIRHESNWIPDDPVTHTGQKWDCNDYRLVRFVDKTKYVNPNFAINLIDEIPPQACNERVVCCNGGGGPLGHPKVYINLDKPGNHICGYCGLRFYLDQCH